MGSILRVLSCRNVFAMKFAGVPHFSTSLVYPYTWSWIFNPIAIMHLAIIDKRIMHLPSLGLD